MLINWIFTIVLFLIMLVSLPIIARKLLFMPTKQCPSELGPNEIFTPEGISMLFYDKGSDTPIIIYSHGNAGNIFSRKYLTDYFVNESLLLYDYRGYGRSPGKVNTKSIIEDGDYVMDYVMTNHPDRKIILWGESMGSAVTWYLAAKYHVESVVIVSGYSKLSNVISDVAVSPIGKILSWLMFLPDNTIYVDKVQCPVLLLHAEDDPLIKLYHAKELIRPSTRLITTRGGHNFQLLPYINEIKEFLANVQV